MGKNSIAATKSYRSINTFKQYWTLDSTDYWHLQYPLNSKWEEYYWDMSEKAFQCKLPRDENGITTYFGEDGNTYYSSIELAQYAMASYQAFLKTNDEYWLNESILHIDYFISLAESYKGADYTILNHYPISLYEIDHPWPTSLGFGVAVSLMVRLHKLTNSQTYLDNARKLIKNFYLNVENGGILREVDVNKKEKLLLLEEYPTNNLSGVLNGHIFGLWGLYDLGTIDEEVNNYFRELSINLTRNLSIWDGGFWSLYDARHLDGETMNYASVHYHMLHVRMILILYRITGAKEYANFAEKLIKQKHGVKSRLKALTLKVFYRLKI